MSLSRASAAGSAFRAFFSLPNPEKRPGAFPGLVHIVPGLAECDECDEIFNVIEQKGYCPNCGSFEKTVLSGKEFTIREIVVPEKSET